MDFLTNNIALLTGGGSAAIALWLLKKIPNAKIYNSVRAVCYSAGSIMTLGLSKWKFTKGFWNKTVEPWFIDLVDNFVGGAVRGFVKGLRSDK